MDGTFPPPTISPARSRWFVLGLLLIFAAVSVQYTLKIKGHRSAILRWRDPVHELGTGTNVYAKYNYPNPPVMGLLLKPVLALPPTAAALVWFYLKVGMTLLALGWIFRLIESPGQPFPPGAMALALLLGFWPILLDLTHGNINLFILFLVIGALFAFQRGHDLLAGGVLGLAIACKVTPLLFVPYLLWKRAWKALAGCAVGLVLFFLAVPALCLGWGENLRLLHGWEEQMVRPYVVSGVVFYSEYPNQSLPGVVFRLVTHSPSFSTYVNDQYVPLVYHNFIALDPALARWLVKGCMAVFAGLVLWTCRTPTVPRHGWRLAAEFGLVLLGMLLFSERTWRHHCVTLVLPFAVIAYYLAVCRPGPGLRAYLLGTLGVVALLMLLTSLGVSADEDGRAHLGQLAQTYGLYTWAIVLLVAALAVLLRQGTNPAKPAGCNPRA
jgi:alpha-1,2-mannosyltransferase